MLLVCFCLGIILIFVKMFKGNKVLLLEFQALLEIIRHFNLYIILVYFLICDTIKRNESLVENFNFYVLTPLSYNFKMLHFSANPITIGYPVSEL